MALSVPRLRPGVVGDGGLVREGNEVGCRGSHGLVAAAVGVNDVYGGREREEAFFEGAVRLIVPVVEGGGMRDRVQLFRFGGDEIAARGGQRVHVSNGVDGLSGDGADLVSVGCDGSFVATRE